MASHPNDPKYWRGRAAELRSIAENITDADAKATILACAGDYDALAVRAAERDIEKFRRMQKVATDPMALALIAEVIAGLEEEKVSLRLEKKE